MAGDGFSGRSLAGLDTAAARIQGVLNTGYRYRMC